METKLKTIELANFRSCKRTKTNLQPDLSALIGTNGSGKSNFLNGVNLLGKMARLGRTYHNEIVAESTCRLKATFSVENKEIQVKSKIRLSTNERNVDEVIGSETIWDFSDFDEDLGEIFLPIHFLDQYYRRNLFGESASGEKQWRYLISDFSRTLGSSSISKDQVAKQLDRILKLSDPVWQYITKISYYSASQFTDPSKCPNFLEVEDGGFLRKSARGGNDHSQFMYDLYFVYKESTSKFKEFLSIVGSQGMNIIDRIEYTVVNAPSNVYKVGIGGRMISREVKKSYVIPNIIVKETTLSPNQLSEGTFRTLALVFYLITDVSRLLLVEEPEVCIHQGLLASILELIKVYSREKQIIVSTHSDFILDGLDPENVYIVKNEVRKGTKIKHITKSMSARSYSALKDYLDTSGNLGEYWRTGGLGDES